MNTLVDLFLTFAYLALVSVGGGVTILPEMERQVVSHQWLTHQDFVEIFALSQLAPGPNMLLVFLIGYRIASFPGAIAAGLGMFTPTSCLLAGLAHFTKEGHPPKWVAQFHTALIPITVGLLAAAAWTIGQGMIDEFYQIIICGGAALAIIKNWANPALVIVLAVMIGVGQAFLPDTAQIFADIPTLIILTLLFSLVIALFVVLSKKIRNALLQDAFAPPLKQAMEGGFSPLMIVRDRPTAAKGTIPLLLLLLTGQSLALLWTSRAAITRIWAETTTAIAQSLQAESNGCRVPSTAAKDYLTYLQVCNAMQDVLNVPKGQFFYGGTMGAAALRSNSFLKEIRLAHPDFQLRYLDPMSIPPDSTTGIRMLLNGELSFSESQRPLRAIEYQQAQEWGFTLKQIPVAKTGAAFYTHPGINLLGLSLEQLKGIYTGKITNWSEVGGPDIAIVPVSQDIDANGSTLSLFLQDVPRNKQKLAGNIQHVRDTTAAVRKVATTPGAIGFGTQVLVVHQHSIRLIGLAKGSSRQFIQPMTTEGQVNRAALANGSYPLIQQIFVVLRQDGTLDEVAGVAYANLLLSNKGKTLMEKAGYLPMTF
jgi:phosphate transport system substrate-binding protein